MAANPRAATSPGRFHRLHDGPTSYLGDSVATCEREIRTRLRGRLLRSEWRKMPADTALTRVADVRQRAVRRAVGITQRELLRRRNVAPCQALGLRLRRRGVQAIAYESVRRRGRTCLAAFLENAASAIAWGPVSPL